MAFQRAPRGELLQRPSETIESLLYFFILAYLIVLGRTLARSKARRLGGPDTGGLATAMAKRKTPRKSKQAPRASLPDPRMRGPYRPFASDPGWNEAWWWLWLPVLGAPLVFVAGFLAPRLYADWIIPEGYGVLEFGQFIIMMAAFVIAVRLLFDPFVRARPFVFAVTFVAALSLPLYRRRGDELGPAFLPLEHAGLLGGRQCGRRDQPA